MRTCHYADGRIVLIDTEPTAWGTLIVTPDGLVIGALPPSSARRAGEPAGFVDHATACRTDPVPRPRRPR